MRLIARHMRRATPDKTSHRRVLPRDARYEAWLPFGMCRLVFINQRTALTLLEQSDRTASNVRGGNARVWHSNTAMVAELARLLLANPGGLRRWTVMQAMRKAWRNAARDIGQKFEDEVERNFRYFSDGDERVKSRELQPEDTLFYRPGEKAGEVWAAYPDRVQAWLTATAPTKE